MNGKDWQTVSSKIVYQNPFFQIREDDVVRPNGNRAPYYVLERQPFAIIVPLTRRRETYLVGQFRYPTQVYSWEFPMGFVKGKSPLETAKIELKQETGLTAEDYQEIGSFYVANGHSNQKGYIYLAQELTEGEPQPEENEFLEIKKMSLKEVGRMIKQQEILDGPTIVAYHLAEQGLGL